MQPTFALTFDLELMWGSLDRMSAHQFEARYPDMRGTIRAILAELDAFEVPATWAAVGHLFLDRCERGAGGRAHPEIVRPAVPGQPSDRMSVDPCTDRASAPLWYGDDLLDWIQSARTEHEIGSHSFSHPGFGDPGMTREAAASELAACVRIARERGIELRSFVFPRNREGFHEVLREHGIIAYRGIDPTWYRGAPRSAWRLAHLVDQGLGLPPPVGRPVERLPGLWNIPGSMLLLHRVGVRRYVPIAARVRKARHGLRRAMDTGSVFHLWTHPMNLAQDREAMLGGLRSILRHVAELRDQGRIATATMAEIATAAAGGDPGRG
jgi:peptidoglycan/xylan/chitin deacetylase (PgdA/CDA1 family)